jgi:DNA-binding transcriptional regulator YdaS (Cro superfamily)
MNLKEWIDQQPRSFLIREFAAKVGSTQPTISNIMVGAQVPALRLAFAIEEATDGAVIWHELMEYCYNKGRPKKARKKRLDK